MKQTKQSINKLKVRGYKSPFYYRTGTSDFKLFKDIFLKTDYAPTLPGARWIIDAGANIGTSTVLFKKRYPNAVIVAIEPDEENCKIFLKNTQPYQGIVLLKGGIASQHNKKMKIKNNKVAAYSFELEYASRGIPSYSINEIMNQNEWDTIDIVKIDIEGGEKELFSANTNWLAVTKQIVIELHDYKIPGCSKALIDAIWPQFFNITFSGENMILTKTNSNR